MRECMERTVFRGDADACILRVKCMLEGQYVEICPLKGAVIRTHWNACIGRLKQVRKFPGAGLAGKVMRGCLCWHHARRMHGKGNQSGLRSFAPSLDLANQRL